MKILMKYKMTIVMLSLSCLFLTTLYTYNKRVYLNVDGEIEVYYTNAISYGFLAENVADKYDLDEYVYDSTYGEEFIVHNDFIELRSKKDIEVTVDGETKNVETYAITPEELQEELELTGDDTTEYIPKTMTLLKNVDDIHFVKVDVVMEEEVHQEAVPEVTVENASVIKGMTSILDAGSPSEYKSLYKVVFYDGKEYSKVLVSKELLKEGTPKTVQVGTKEIPNLPANYASGSTVWDSIAACESGGNWAINTGNGYYGGLQFSAATWRTAAGAVGVSAEYAHQASREEQIRAAEWMLSRSSWSQQWPSCSKKLGLW